MMFLINIIFFLTTFLTCEARISTVQSYTVTTGGVPDNTPLVGNSFWGKTNPVYTTPDLDFLREARLKKLDPVSEKVVPTTEVLADGIGTDVSTGVSMGTSVALKAVYAANSAVKAVDTADTAQYSMIQHDTAESDTVNTVKYSQYS